MISIKRQARIVLAIILAGFAILCLFSVDEFNPVRVAVLGRPDIIDAKLRGSGYSTLSMETVDLTIYEYVDLSQLITTGEGYRFRFPKAYLRNTVALGGGAVQWIPLEFDLETGKPISVVEHDRSGSPGFSYDRDIMNNRVTVVLSIRGELLPKSRALVAARERRLVPATGQLWKNRRPFGTSYAYLGKTYSGLDMFDIEGPRPASRRMQSYPFTEAIVFARPSDDGAYSLIVRCNDKTTYSWCWTSKPYGPHTHLIIHFSGTRLDQIDNVISRSKQLLEDHLIERLHARKGWGKLD